MNEQQIPSTSPKERARDLLKREPSKPGFTQSTNRYADACIDTSMALITDTLSRQFPQLAENFQAWHKGANSEQVHISASDFVIVDGEIQMKTPADRIICVSDQQKALFHANPSLGRFEHALRMFTPEKDKKEQRFPGFNMRFKNIVSSTGLPLDDPRIMIIAVGYNTQIAKIEIVEKSKALLERANTFGGIAVPGKLKPYVRSTHSDILEIRRNQAYVRVGLNTVQEIAEKVGFGSDQVEFLFDIAFMSAQGITSDHMSQILQPLFRMVRDGEWEKAFAHRDFLLKNLATVFPEWRGHKFAKMTDSHQSTTLNELARAVMNGDVEIPFDEIPSEYAEFFTSKIARRVTLFQHKEELKNAEVMFPMNRLVLKELASRSIDSFITYFKDMYFTEKDMHDLQEIAKDEEGRRAFGRRVSHIFSNLEKDTVSTMEKETLIDNLWLRLCPYAVSEIDLFYPSPTPLAVYYTSEKNGIQHYYSRKFNQEGPSGRVPEILYKLIRGAYESHEWPGKLYPDELRSALEKSYQAMIRRHKSFASISLPDYVISQISQRHEAELGEPASPSSRFIQSLTRPVEQISL